MGKTITLNILKFHKPFFSIDLEIDVSKSTILLSSHPVSAFSSKHKSRIETLVDHQIPDVSVSSKSKFDIFLSGRKTTIIIEDL